MALLVRSGDAVNITSCQEEQEQRPPALPLAVAPAGPQVDEAQAGSGDEISTPAPRRRGIGWQRVVPGVTGSASRTARSAFQRCSAKRRP